MHEDDLVNQVDAFAAKMQRGYFHKYVIHPHQADDRVTNQAIANRRKSYRKPPKPDEVISICHKAIVLKLMFKDIAKEHNMTVGAISVYVQKAKKNKQYLDEVYAKQNAR